MKWLKEFNMNERIKELIEQATSNISVVHEGYRSKGYTEQVEYFDKEKFAELIVEECAGMFDKNETEYAIPEQRIHNSIMIHFGLY
jgi:hypothetical protein